jgi:hypothetical protein
MVLRFDYRSVKRIDGGISKSPSIPIVLIGKEIVETNALLDSGAEVSAISKEFAEYLGLDLKGKKDFSFGIGGKINSIETSLTIVVQQKNEKYKFKIPFDAILSDYNFPVLLGRKGFFDKFIIKFNQQKGKVSLKKIGKLRW